MTGSGGKQKGAVIPSSAYEKSFTAVDLASKYFEKKGKGKPLGVLFTLAEVAIRSQSNGPNLAHIL